MDNEVDIVELVSKTFMMWAIRSMEGKDESIFEADTDVDEQFAIKIITGKLKWAGVDVKIPYELKIILVICSETPADVQTIMTEILDKVLETHDNKIPVGYEITHDDFVNAYTMRFPIAKFYPDMRKHFDDKWDAQKIPHEKAKFIGTDNQYDTHEFWNKYRNT